ncbi:hypothetical protein [Bacillus licheniformis]|uniref:hypothetical protein n=1 Tax=Bacillus licheniformis TaxID=1402 RepID=UPI001F115B3C|nr:hypothetical protein [Bacillus licheniformis]
MKVVCTSPSFAKYSDDPVLFLEKKGMSLERLPADITEEQFIEAAEGADAAIVAFNQITPYVLDRLPSLKIVCKHGVGVDNIDLHAAKERNVWVTNAPTPTSMQSPILYSVSCCRLQDRFLQPTGRQSWENGRGFLDLTFTAKHSASSDLA